MQYRPDLRAQVLISRIKSGTELGRQIQDVLSDCGLPVMRATIGDRIAFQESIAAGQGATEYAPRTKAAHEIERVVSELVALTTHKQQEN